MKKALLLLAILLGIGIQLNCVNHLDIMTTMTGEFYGSRMGNSMASLDFNGDGIKDLVVSSANWNPSGAYNDSQMYGKLYFYYGGGNFDNIPEYTLEGTNHVDFNSVFNAGDINNDGKEDIGVISRGIYGTDYKFKLFYGRDIPQTSPDYQSIYPSVDYAEIYAYPLGDINHDNFDDVALVQLESYLKKNRLFTVNTQILLGGSMNQTNWITTNSDISFNGIGDVNNDGIDDFHMYTRIPGQTSLDNRLVIYYGSNNFPDCDSLVISDNTNEILWRQGCPVGDVNGDGIADFISYMSPSGGRIWHGGNNLTNAWNLLITPPYFGGGDDDGVVYGDLNGDGYDDVIGSWPNYSGENGIACIWLGGHYMNGTTDWQHMEEFPHLCRYGWAKATGDFNNDGLCDLAISKPNDTQYLSTQGIIYVYSGNTELSDTTPVNDEVITPPDTDFWSISVYPNPIKQKKSDINIRFTGKGYKQPLKLIVSIYNTKGQIIKTSKISRKELLDYTYIFKLKRVVPGKYIISVSEGNRELVNKQVTIF